MESSKITEGKKEGQFEGTKINGGKYHELEVFISQSLITKYLEENVQSKLDLQTQLGKPPNRGKASSSRVMEPETVGDQIMLNSLKWESSCHISLTLFMQEINMLTTQPVTV